MKKKRLFHRDPVLSCIVCLLVLSLAAGGCGKASPQVQTTFAFDTVVSITYYAGSDSGAVMKVMDRLEYYEKIFSRTDPESELYGVNARLAEAAAQGQTNVRVSLSHELYEALSMALEYAELTGGAFDPTLGKLSEIYDFSGKEHRVPTEAERAEILSHCGCEKLKLAPSSDKAYPYQLTAEDPDIVIDLGGMAKGWIADSLKMSLQLDNVSSAIINLGGNLLMIGNKPDGNPYAVGVLKPENGSSEYLTSFKISDKSAVTSGSYQRFFEQDGVTYHHILDPATGLPAESGLKSVTVIADNSAAADILSTAFFVMGEEKTSAFLENCTNIDVYLVNEDYVVNKIPQH